MDRILAFIVIGLLVVGVCGGGIAWYLGRSSSAALTAATVAPTAVPTSDIATRTEAATTTEATKSTNDWLAATKAFHAINASKQANCQELAYIIATPEQRKTDPAFAQSPLQYAGGLLYQDGVFEAAAVIDAGRCLDDVRTETSDDLPAEYPTAYLRGACQKVRPHLASDQVKGFFADAKIDAVQEVRKYCKSIDAWK